MFNGLKKIVGKGADDTLNINNLQSSVQSVQLNAPSNKFTKKRKVIEREPPPSLKKKYEYDFFFNAIFSFFLYIHLYNIDFCLTLI